MELTLFDKAKQALALAKSTDEVLEVKNRAMAMKLYAKQAHDKSLELDALEIRMRAERRLGEMMRDQPKDHGGGDTSTGVRKTPVQSPIKFAEAGIDKNLAKRARKLAAMPEDKFETMLADEKSILALGVPNSERTISDKEAKPLIPTSSNILFKTRQLKDYIIRCPEILPKDRAEITLILNSILKELGNERRQEETEEHSGSHSGLHIVR